MSILEILPSTLPDTITIYFPRRNANRKCNKIKLPGTVSLLCKTDKVATKIKLKLKILLVMKVIPFRAFLYAWMLGV